MSNHPAASGDMSLPNSYLNKMDNDFMYHIGYSRDECKSMFGDVKFVICGGSMNRMGVFAEMVAQAINYPKTTKEELSISKTDRFSFYKIGPVLSVSHGMGVPSVTIMLHEIIKLLRYAGTVDPIIIRLGTSGGVGVPAGTVVITNKAFNAFSRETHDIVVLGKTVSRPAIMNQDVAKDILSCQDDKSFPTVLGGTMCTDDFFEGQGRTDGAVCGHTEEEKMEYLKSIKDLGVSNIEMECTAVAALTHHASMKSAVVCVALLDRLQGDQVTMTPDEYKVYQQRPQALVCKFIKSKLGK